MGVKLDLEVNSTVAREITIGAIPGYNTVIDPYGKYKKRLMENLTKVKFIPASYKINWSNISDKGGQTSIKDVISISRIDATGKFQKTQLANGIPDGSVASTISIISTGDSTFNETITNDYDLNRLGQMINSYRQSNVAQIASTTVGVVSASGITGNSDKRDAVAGTAVNDVTGGLLGENGAALGTIIGAGLGLQISLPKSWKTSSYNNTLTLSIKLTSPDGSKESIEKYILNQLQYLLLLSSPVTSNGFVTGYPYLFSVEAQGSADIPIAMVLNMTIIRGGADTVFNKDGMPTMVEVRMTIGNVFDYIAMAYQKAFESDGVAGITTVENFRRSILNEF